MNIMKINGYDAVIAYDEEIEMFRGEFVGLNGGADFYSTDIAGLHREGEISLQVFLSACQERGIEPRKNYSGKFHEIRLRKAARIKAMAGNMEFTMTAEELRHGDHRLG